MLRRIVPVARMTILRGRPCSVLSLYEDSASVAHSSGDAMQQFATIGDPDRRLLMFLGFNILFSVSALLALVRPRLAHGMPDAQTQSSQPR